MRRWRLLGMLSIAAAACAAVACGSFGSNTGPSGDAGLADGDRDVDSRDGDTLPDGAPLDASTDAATSAVVEPACPPSPPPKCAPEECTRRKLYSPTGASTFPFAIATDSAFVYWLEQSEPVAGAAVAYDGKGVARVLRVDRSGSAGPAILATAQPQAVALALAPPHLYWATWDEASARALLKRTLVSCSPPCDVEDLTMTSITAPITKLVGVGSTAVLAMLADGKILRFAITAGVVGLPSPLTTTDYFPGMTVTASHIYASSLLSPFIARADIDGGSVSTQWASLPDAGGDVGLANLATDCTDLFGVRAPNATVQRVKLATGEITKVTTLNSAVFDIAVDQQFLYAASLNGGGLVQIEKTSGNARSTSVGTSVRNVAVDSLGVYWADHAKTGGGTLYMMVK